MGIITKKIDKRELGTDTKVVEPSEHPFADALTGNDPPMETAHPGLGPALVFLAYPLAIIFLITIVSVYFMSTQKDGRHEAVTPATQSPSDVSTTIQAP
ncbi:MAG TPA: hypothetical protein VM260_24260 [Pirellula sp.]|nr:hypothetical protein [Pirellula sp.]